MLAGDLFLSRFDHGVQKFLYPTTFLANDVIVVGAIIQFENGATTLKIMAFDQTRSLELRQDPIHGREADIIPGIQQ